MADTNCVLQDTCNARREGCDQRVQRDEQRFQQLEDMQRQFLTLQGQLTEILKNQEIRVTDHETRIRGMEDNPKKWFDRIVSGILAAVIAALVSFATNVGSK